MKIFISIFLILILIFTSKIKINVISLKRSQKSLKIDFDVNVAIYLLGIIKIFEITFKNNGIHFMVFLFSYPKKGKIKIHPKGRKTLLENIQKLDLKIEKFDFNLKLGCEDMNIMVFSVFAISTILSIMSAKNSKNINMENFHYKITPIYNMNTLEFNISGKVDIALRKVLKLLISKKKKTYEDYKIFIKLKSPMKI